MNAIVPHLLPDVPPPTVVDEPRFEIVDGQRVEIAPMSYYAGVVASTLLIHLGYQLRGKGYAVTDTLFRLPLPTDRIRRPDMAFVSHERWPKDRPMISGPNAWEVAPDLAVEVISPTDRAEESVVKLAEYFRAGVRLAWVIYPTPALVYVYESLTQVRGLTRADTLDGGAVLPGFRLPLAELFPPT